MNDLITYAKDITLLLAEVEAKLPDYLIKDDKGNPTGFAVTKTPTVRKGNETLYYGRGKAACWTHFHHSVGRHTSH